MFAKLQLDSSNLHILCSTRTSPLSIGVSVSPSEKSLPVRKLGHKVHLESCDEDKPKKFDRVNKKMENYLENQLFDANTQVKHRKLVRFDDGIVDKTAFGVIIEGENCRGSAERGYANCSKKWVAYGGDIPAILQALETVKDLDEAFKPWAEKLSNKKRTIILKEQSSWERAMEIFEWFKSKECYELNVIHYNIMLRILGKARKWSYAQRFWDEMTGKRIEPINSTYGTLIDVYSKSGMKLQAFCYLGMMIKQGMKPDEVTMGTVVQMYKMVGEFQKAEEFFMRWSSNQSLLHHEVNNCNPEDGDESPFRLSSYAYNTLIDTYGKSGQLKEASETFSRMLKERIVPTTVTFNTMIHIYGNNGKLEEINALMKKMKELQCLPDTRTYNILISVHAKHNNINTAANYFVKMKESCLEPDPVSYRTLLYAFSIRQMVEEAESLMQEIEEKGLWIDEYTQSAITRMYIESGMLKKSWLWFLKFHHSGTMSSDGYSANIDAYAERGHACEAEKAFICCRAVRKLTVLAFNVMIKAYGIGKFYEKACNLFDSMENYNVTPDKCSYSSLIQILAGGDMPQIALHYLRKMQEAGLVRDCIPYCTVISSFVKLGQYGWAEEVYREMVIYSIEPDIIVYGVLINAFADIGSVKEAMTYVDAMRNAGLPGNTVIYNSLIKLYTKIGYLKEAEDIYKRLQYIEAHPDIYSSNCMIDLYTERSMVKQAEEIFKSLKRRREANEFTFAMMLCMYKRNGRFEEAAYIAKEMRELRFVTGLLSYNSVLDLYALDGRFKEAVDTFKEMVNADVQPDDYTFKSLGAVLVKCGVSKKAVRKIEATRKNDAQRGLQVWMSTLCSVVGVDAGDSDVDGEDASGYAYAT